MTAVTITTDTGSPTLVAGDVVSFAGHGQTYVVTAGTSDLSLGTQILSMTDAQTGLSLRLKVSRRYKQTVWEFDVLWGVKLVRPELAVCIAG